MADTGSLLGTPTPETEFPPSRTSLPSGLRSIDDSVHWFHGSISRSAAEDVLRENGGRDGLYLVRESVTSPGDFALSLVHEGSVLHFQIRRHGEDAFFACDEGPVIHGLDELIAHYEQGGLVAPLREMCKGQPPPHETRRHGRTNLLHRATKQCDYTVVMELLQSDYNIDAKNQDGQTALHLGCLEGSSDIVLALLERSASTHCLDGTGHTPLHYACKFGHLDCVGLLLDHGSSTQIRALGSRWVALHEAAYQGNMDIVKLLLDYGAAARPRAQNDELPVDLVPKGRPELEEFLRNYKDLLVTSKHREEWYHGNVSRDEATARLHSAPSGSFLVRTSKAKGNILVLSMISNDYTYHFEIHRKDGRYFIDDGPLLDSLESLIHYYSCFQDGLPCHLGSPVKPVLSPVVSTRVSPGWKQSSYNLPGMNSSHLEMANLISKDSLELADSIGEGEFGSVLRGVWVRNFSRADVAVKTLREEHSTVEKREGFVREVEVMVALNHPCIVRLIGVCLGPPLMMVQELVPLGSLLHYITTKADTIFVEVDFPRWSQQIANGMNYLKSKRFVHRDLAARNILLASRMQAKISDFGLSRALQVGNDYYRATKGGKWPLKWYAPESINFGSFSHSSDVWSFAVTLWEMYSFAAEQPYGSMTGMQVLEYVESGKRLLQPDCCPNWCYNIMLKCWNLKPEKRPQFGELYKLFGQRILVETVVLV